MNLKEMIEILQAAERGEKIEVQTDMQSGVWQPWKGTVLHFDLNYRIAPKKEMTLVEELKAGVKDTGELISSAAHVNALMSSAAYRIQDLEHNLMKPAHIDKFTTDELLAEIKRRCEC
jgi:hypothetical protein